MHVSIEDNQCCGVKELDGISDFDSPKETLLKLIEQEPDTLLTERYHNYYGLWTAWDGNIDKLLLNDTPPKLGHLIFTQATYPQMRNDGYRRGYGTRLARYIKEHKLGTVIRSSSTVNPNHQQPGEQHTVTVFVWTPDAKHLWSWWKTQVGSAVFETYRQAAVKRLEVQRHASYW